MRSIDARADGAVEATSVYVHFPYCLQKCPYCDFASGAIRRHEVPHAAYADAICRELDWRADGIAGRRLASVFFGGGTPSLWAASELGRVLRAILAAFECHAPDLEVTVECNPSSLDRPGAAALAEAGVNRLSIGVQSLVDERLRFLGRLHDAQGAMRAVVAGLQEVPRVSADLIFGTPGQTPEGFVSEVNQLRELGLEHLSLYALTIEPAPQFGQLHRKGRLSLASDGAFAQTFLAAREHLESRGLVHYEVSNYALPGQESRHNVHYWQGADYLGLGAGAVGCLSEGTVARRYRNDPAPERYLARSGQRGVESFSEALGPVDRIREALMLGLRTAGGVDLAALGRRVGRDPRVGREPAFDRALATQNLVLEGSWARVPKARWLHLDGIVADLF